MGRQTVDIVLISDNESEKKAVSSLMSYFGYTVTILETVDAVLECQLEPALMIASQLTTGEQVPVDEMLQMSRQQFPNSFIISIVDSELTKERFAFLRKLGAKVVMLKHEMTTAKLAFVVNQYLKASYVPLKTVDLAPEAVTPFTIFHLLPSRKKFLQVHRKGEKLSQERLEKFGPKTELYLSREEIVQYKAYTEEFSDRSAKGLAKRCRANFTHLQAEFSNLAIELSDISNKVSYGDGQNLLQRCQGLCSELLNNLAEFPNAWEIINNSSVGEFGSLERATAVSAYSGVFSLQLEQENTIDIMMTALLVDMGVLTHDDTLATKIRNREVLGATELVSLRSVPQKSIDMALSRKVALSEKIRSILLGTYEQADGKGYPKGIYEDKLLFESQIIRFAKEFDSKTAIRLGSLKKDPLEALKDIFGDPKNKGVFTAQFIEAVTKKVIQDAFARAG